MSAVTEAAPPRRGRGLARRLMLAQGIVLVASILSAGLVASLLGPPIFHDHLIQAGHPANSPEFGHIELAYRDASTLSLGIALLVAVIFAAAVTWSLTRRLQTPLATLTEAAGQMARGRYQTRVRATGAALELDSLANAFNEMAERLDHVEDTRRRLLSDLAHELRTPVSTITAYLDGLEDGVTSWDEGTSQVLRDQTSRLARLATDIGDVSRAEEGRMTMDRRRVRVADLIQSAAEVARDAYTRKGVGLTTNHDGVSGAAVDVDEQRIGQVMANLLSNALRHTPAGGAVTIGAHPGGSDVRMAVADNGEGFTSEQGRHVFERFYRGDSARDRDHAGSGIGLTISKALVEAHGGDLWAHSDGPGRGATFTVVLPRADPRGS